jgi:hypothetical protein
VPSKALRWVAVLVLAASQTAIGEHAFARSDGSSGMSSGRHFVAGHHFGHQRFSHRFRRRPIFVAPYGWAWPYADYGEVPSADYGNTIIVAYPPPLSTNRPADNCRWNEDTFTVPSSAGGTRPIQVVTCR